MTPTKPEDALVERLRRRHVCREGSGKTTVHHLINPDGPEAADAITTLLERERRATEALTPGAGTKGAYIGEFSFTIDEDERQVDVPWTTIKEIMAAIKARAALTGEAK